jgi:chromosome segregation protein
LLRLKRVEIQGFKSFCDRTELRFPGQGLAAIVGPNGCGKSNVADAINWVLGEQSAKSLRGTRMEDVIFAGTRDRKPLGMAQVTLTLLDPEGKTEIPGARPDPAKGHIIEVSQVEAAEIAAVEHTNGHTSGHANGHANGHTNGHTNGHAHPGKDTEITITRRLFRSGESEYLINGRIARLRDIQELFMGTGLGPESYAIIEQGRIGQILSSKPLDRRNVIEEAAGISKFKTKRRLAEAKLEGAKQNLTRVFDILEEVSRQVNSLKRQASKAKRFEELKNELTAQLKFSLAGRFSLLEREAKRVSGELEQAAKLYQEIHLKVEEEEKALHEAREAAYRTEAELTENRTRLSTLQLDAERARGQFESQSGMIARIEERLAQGEQENENLAQRLASFEEERKTLAASLEELAAEAAEARERMTAKNAEREALQVQLAERERGLDAARQLIVRLLGESSTLRNQVAQIEGYLASLERDTSRVKKDEETASLDLHRLETVKQDLSDKLSGRQMELESTADQRKRVEADLAERRQASQHARQELETLRSETSRLRARRDSLEEILSHRAYTTESVKRLFTAIERGEAGGVQPAGVLADFVELTDAKFEKATEEFLHDELEYVVVRDWAEAVCGIDLLRGDVDGRATFLVEPNLGSGQAIQFGTAIPEPVLGPETGIVGRLSDGLRFTNGLTKAPAALLPRLARCFLAEDPASAQRLSLQYPDLYFLLPDGVCYHGYAVSGGKKTSAGPLALKRELRESTAALNTKESERVRTQDQVQSLERDIQTLSEELERLRVEQQRQEKETLALDHEMRKVSEDYQRANQRLSVARLELERLTRENGRASTERAAKQVQVEEREQARAAEELTFEQGRRLLDDLKGQAARLAEEHSVLRVEVAGLEERRRAADAALQRLDSQAGEVTRRREHLHAELERLTAERARLIESNIQLEARSKELAAEIEQIQQSVAQLASSEAAQRAALAAREEELKAHRAAGAEAQERRSQIELELVRRQSELKFLDETSRKELNVSLDELDRPETEPDELTVAEAEQRAQDLRARIEALGPVNPEAWHEFQEAQQRYDFLNTQRQDLLDSIRDTEKAIQEIDVESRKRFTEAFHAINEHFKEMFRTLFGGGAGEMRLTGEGDVLDQGIEIVAQPPGKRLQNVMLLSGGEKALTATALLMAIFKYTPSPFCILDEVDAPLDEANVTRFTQLVKAMSGTTQFIVITHAKKTMESAEALYGVTMQEQGVSKLVSVRFNTAAVLPLPPSTVTNAATA